MLLDDLHNERAREADHLPLPPTTARTEQELLGDLHDHCDLFPSRGQGCLTDDALRLIFLRLSRHLDRFSARAWILSPDSAVTGPVALPDLHGPDPIYDVTSEGVRFTFNHLSARAAAVERVVRCLHPAHQAIPPHLLEPPVPPYDLAPITQSAARAALISFAQRLLFLDDHLSALEQVPTTH